MTAFHPRRALWYAVLLVVALSSSACAWSYSDFRTFTDPYTGQELLAAYIDGPAAPPGILPTLGLGPLSPTTLLLGDVPTSSWTYGCSATSAGMLFGYYDRTGYSNMYTGPANGGVCPMTNLGSACSIIATMNGFDGRTTNGHVDDYWTGYLNSGPDPFVGNWPEHTWADCTADFMGTNQWKWDTDENGSIDSNVDGGTIFWLYGDGSPLYDCIQPDEMGLPATEGCHGLRLFAESRGYSVLTNYTQMVDTYLSDEPAYSDADGASGASAGFTFADYMNEIDGGCPVLIQLEGHTMLGVGYDSQTDEIYVHDTWGDYTGVMDWGGSYGGMTQWGVTVLHLAPLDKQVPEPCTSMLLLLGLASLSATRRRRRNAA